MQLSIWEKMVEELKLSSLQTWMIGRTLKSPLTEEDSEKGKMIRWKAIQFCWAWGRNETSKRHWKDRKRSVTGKTVQAACKEAYLRVTLNLWQPVTSEFPNKFVLLSEYSLPKL